MRPSSGGRLGVAQSRAMAGGGERSCGVPDGGGGTLARRGWVREDRRFLVALQGRLDAAVRRAGRHLACRLGCTECCVGPFDITPLDAWRLRRGLAGLAARRPDAAAAIVGRAREQWARMAVAFPGDPVRGVLSQELAAREAFFAAFAALPCPALDPPTGACQLYDSRPVSCRTFGLPIRCGDQLLPPCRLNFTTAAPEEVTAATVDPDPDDLEGELLQHCGAEAGDTIVAWVLASSLER